MSYSDTKNQHINVIDIAKESHFNDSSLVTDILRFAKIAQWECFIADGRMTINSELCAVCGYTTEELYPLTLHRWKTLIHPDDLPIVHSSLEQLVEKKSDSLEVTYRLRTAWGEWRYFLCKGGIAEFDRNQSVLRIAGILQDVTDQKIAEISAQCSERLMKAVNDIASLLLSSHPENFESYIGRSLSILGTAAEVDRVYLWENGWEDGELFATQTYEWSPCVPAQQETDLTVKIKYSEVMPQWLESFMRGECINNIVRYMPQTEQSHLLPQGVLSILAAPIFIEGELRGFIGFDDCQHERRWGATEVEILRSAGLMIASAIQRHMIFNNLNHQRKVMNRIVDTSPISIFTITNGVVNKINQKGKKLFDIQEGTPTETVYAQILGMHKDAFIRYHILDEMKNKGIFLRHNVQYRCLDGLVHDFIVAAIPVDMENIKKAITWIIDVTELKMTERALTLAVQKAEKATQAKSDFLAQMSHEIRTPMNAILGMIYLCLQTELNSKQMEYLTTTQSAAHNLLGLINDILDFSKIEAGKLELESIPFSLNNTIKDVIDTMKLSAEQKGLKLITKIDPEIDDAVIGDPLRLRQILLNLISNALKFTAKGGVLLTVKGADLVLREEADKVRLTFEVKDTGIGLQPEQIGTIFNSFTQAEGSITRKYGGTGLGLAIVKSLVLLMGGQINVTSIPGQGATFTFSVLFTRAVVHAEMSSAILLSKRRVLIIDDNVDDLTSLADLLESAYISTSSARSGQSALKLLEDASDLGSPFELVIVDWRMPQMDGIETIRLIRQNTKIVPPHILMSSHYDRKECLRQVHGLNVADVLTKPVELPVLKETLKSLFRQSVAESAEKTTEIRTDIRGAHVLLAEDNKINQMVAQELLSLMQVKVTVANNGLEAVEAVKREDFDLILMDIQMPAMDGLTAAATIRHLDKPGVESMPILAMTANAMDTDYQKSLEVGMNDHLTKPIDPSKLRLALEKWIVRAEARRAE